MLPGAYSSVLQARTRDEFRDEVVRFAQRLGFSTVSAVAVVDRGTGEREFLQVDNTPESYQEPYADRRTWARDPVMQHLKRNSMPIIWNQGTYVECGAEDLWEQQSSHGYHTGIAMALHLPEGRHFIFGVDRDQDLPTDAGELQRLVADLQLFCVHAQESALRILLPEVLSSERPALTPRELECLRWTMEGKTAWEVGAILGISERTAVLHLNNAMHKLGCSGKHQAVLKAMRLGLIY